MVMDAIKKILNCTASAGKGREELWIGLRVEVFLSFTTTFIDITYIKKKLFQMPYN